MLNLDYFRTMSSGKTHIAFYGALLVAALFSAPVMAADAAYASTPVQSLASDWAITDYAGTRLVSSRSAIGPKDTEIVLGFQIDLKPGWKTYWRSPGEAGMPPRWHWRKAENVLDVAVAWPLPKRSSFFGIETVGYERQVVFPITVKLARPGAAVSLDLKVDYSVCENICVPLQGRYQLDIPAAATAKPARDASLIKTYSRQVPSGAHLADDGPGGLKITRLHLAHVNGNPTILVDAAGDQPMARADVFVEGPSELGFGAPRRLQGKTAKVAHFSVPVYSDGANIDRTLARSPLVITLTDGSGNAAEYRLKVQ